MRLNAFTPLRPPADLAAEICSPPYDVIDSAGAREMVAENSRSFLHVIKPEIDLPEGTDLYHDDVYAQARTAFEQFQTDGLLVREAEPTLYAYQQQSGDHTQCGIVGLCHIEDYENNVIKKHEYTLKKKEDDRTRHVKTLMANAGPVFLTYRDDATIQSIIDSARVTEPVTDLTDEAGVRHTVWRIENSEALIGLFGGIDCAYVADGHHRSASAARVGAELRAANPDHTGEEPYNWYLCVLFPADELQVLAYNRLVADLNGRDSAAFLAEVEKVFEVSPGVPVPEKKGDLSMCLDGVWHTLRAREVDADDPIASLDVAILQYQLLAPILGIEDPKTNSRISFKGGAGSTDFLEAKVKAGEAAVAFSLFPTGIRDMMAVADIDKVMPPKSTWFEPKLRSGLFVHTLDA